MSERYRKSNEAREQLKAVTPGGAQTLSKMPARFPSGAFPAVLKYAAGAEVEDVDGNTYVDWICGLGAVTLGHNRPEVNTAVAEVIQEGGPSFSLPHERELRTAELLCEVIPCAEMVRFVKTGSEAAEAAIRTARIATGRDIILTVGGGYHSWHSWFQAVKPWHPGVPLEYQHLVKSFEYNNLESLRTQLVIWGKRTAAVMMEPCLFEKPHDGYLQGVRELCDKFDVLLIFDEVVCGGRWALAGGQEYFRVTPDLATFGKGLANGYPLGFLCGKADLMKHAELISGTFGGDTVALAACEATVKIYQMEDVCGKMEYMGERLQSAFDDVRPAGLLCAIDGYGFKPRIKFTYSEDETMSIDGFTHPKNAVCMSLFLQETARYGALFHPGGFNVNASLTDAQTYKSIQAIHHALLVVQDAVKSSDWSLLQGEVITPVVNVRRS